jgi:uncharacterized protein YjbI with pentapeptide repeats
MHPNKNSPDAALTPAGIQEPTEDASQPERGLLQAAQVAPRVSKGPEGLSQGELTAAIEPHRMRLTQSDVEYGLRCRGSFHSRTVFFNDKDASGLDFKDSFIMYCDFSNTDMSNVNLAGANLTRVHFKQMESSHLNAERVYAHEASFENVNFDCAQFREAKFHKCEFYGVSLSNACLAKAQFGGLTSAYLGNVKNNLIAGRLDNVDFSAADLSHAIFNDISLSAVDFSHADLTGAKFSSIFINPKFPPMFSNTVLNSSDMRNAPDFALLAIRAMRDREVLDTSGAKLPFWTVVERAIGTTTMIIPNDYVPGSRGNSSIRSEVILDYLNKHYKVDIGGIPTYAHKLSALCKSAGIGNLRPTIDRIVREFNEAYNKYGLSVGIVKTPEQNMVLLQDGAPMNCARNWDISWGRTLSDLDILNRSLIVEEFDRAAEEIRYYAEQATDIKKHPERYLTFTDMKTGDPIHVAYDAVRDMVKVYNPAPKYHDDHGTEIVIWDDSDNPMYFCVKEKLDVASSMLDAKIAEQHAKEKAAQ